jgi:hypothetical protein
MFRQSLVWTALVMTLLACWWVNQQEQASSAITQVRSNSVPKVLASTQVKSAQRLLREADTSPPSDLFSPLTIQTDTSAAAAQAVIPEPVNPYTYDGRVLDDKEWIVFLTDGTHQFALREGEHFANGWKVRQLTESLLVLQNGKVQHALTLAN